MYVYLCKIAVMIKPPITILQAFRNRIRSCRIRKAFAVIFTTYSDALNN